MPPSAREIRKEMRRQLQAVRLPLLPPAPQQLPPEVRVVSQLMGNSWLLPALYDLPTPKPAAHSCKKPPAALPKEGLNHYCVHKVGQTMESC